MHRLQIKSESAFSTRKEKAQYSYNLLSINLPIAVQPLAAMVSTYTA